ncbi:hypothetical protein PHYSODRAFT_324095 [Phytophthora sojae]|uniref:TauD/TfdA-like domain-containing protein n=1 Tax=Phytophthora sojae (strain P6497) TaxID=1094619 RepID=G4Z0U5_PHYSP|nr:hypothetical protein PHYSODRAFT_324095 [Phytophthora sojae]EGZ22784.1 hypothetical protein PHYSODRAFT_324095 [Phytophthora sojae]|eukprot:XP_009518072.1 hypothetical protein PHYSODRAFT_324095 [Phytophthora sojae]
MAPKNNDSTSASAPTTAGASSPVPIKNALNLEVKHAPFTHPELRGEFPTKTYDPIPVLPYEDRALKADPTFKNLLADATVTHLEPKIGTEVSGLQLHELTDAQKDELALLVAQRGVVFFRDQKISIEEQHFNQWVWHSDVSYERQAYERLTPQFKKFVEGLTATHSSKLQAEATIAQGRTLHRPIVEFEHPVVRTHPVTKRKALYVNSEFTTRINNLSTTESVLRFLTNHIAQGHEFQIRYHWTKDAVAIWDNRVTAHYATFDYLPGKRHAVRVTPHGEVPYLEHPEKL